MIGRREFIGLVGGAVVVWPRTARAQHSAMPVVGFLSSFSSNERNTAAFNQGLMELGFVDGQKVVIDYRYAEGHYDQLPGLAAELVRQHVAAIFATGGNGPALAAKAATTTIPIVFESGGSDPAQLGLVASINRPGGNITGISIVQTAVLAKRFELLHQLVPKAETIGVLFNPSYPDAELQIREVQDAAASIKCKIDVASARTEDDLDAAFVDSHSTWRECVIPHQRSIFQQPSWTNRCACCALRPTGSVFFSLFSSRGRTDELWH